MATQKRNPLQGVPVWVQQLGGVLLLLISLTGLVNALTGTGARLKEAQQVARSEDMNTFVAYFTAGAENGGELVTALGLIALTVISLVIGYIGYRLTTGENVIKDKDTIPEHREGVHTGHQRLRNIDVAGV